MLIYFSTSFSEVASKSLRSIALLTTADLIDSNADLQLKFSSIDVPYIDPNLPQQLKKHSGDVPVVTALLNWCLLVNSVHLFDIRVAAAHLIHAYFEDNKEAKAAFVQDQIIAYNSTNEDEIASGDSEQKDLTPVPSNPIKNQVNGEANEDGYVNHIAKPNLKPAPIGKNMIQKLD